MVRGRVYSPSGDSSHKTQRTRATLMGGSLHRNDEQTAEGKQGAIIVAFWIGLV